MLREFPGEQTEGGGKVWKEDKVKKSSELSSPKEKSRKNCKRY